MTPTPATSARIRLVRTRAASTPAAGAAMTSFADIAERLNPAVVNIDATMTGTASSRRRHDSSLPGGPEYERRSPAPDRDLPRRGAGTGFIIDPSGYILTNHHVIADSSRISVRLTDGRTLRAQRIGSDPDTDIALIKVESPRPLPHAALGDSDDLRVGEWVLAIGNPLAYEHTVTVGVVSYIGRKLFDSALDRYIQTDAAINSETAAGRSSTRAARSSASMRRSVRVPRTSALRSPSTRRPPSCRSFANTVRYRAALSEWRWKRSIPTCSARSRSGRPRAGAGCRLREHWGSAPV